MKTFHLAIIILSFTLAPILSNVAFGSEPCPASGYVHYGPSRQSIPCYLVYPQYTSTLAEQSKTINKTNTSVLLNSPVFCAQHFNQGPTLGETIGEKQCENPIYQINYNGANLTVTNLVNKTTFKMAENVTVTPEITTMGNHNVTIHYCGPLFVTLTTDQFGKIVWPQYSWACPLFDNSLTLSPNVSTPGESYGQIIRLAVPGNYTITSIASFGGGSNAIILWSKPLQITVLPEKYVQNTNSTISQNVMLNRSVNDCDKQIGDERDSILDSIDKQKAILLAESDKDFQGLVGDSKYIAGEPSVGGNMDYNKCGLADPNIQVQFNVLTPNSNLGNCPYVIAVEDKSASKVLAIDLGSCSASSVPIPNPIDVSQTSTVIVVGGIIGATAGGLSIFIMMKKK